MLKPKPNKIQQKNNKKKQLKAKQLQLEEEEKLNANPEEWSYTGECKF